MELISKAKSLERETELMRRSGYIVKAVITSNKEMTKLWGLPHTRGREWRRNSPEEPVVEEFLAEGEAIRDDNHTVFAWKLHRMMKQPNREPSSYWAEVRYRPKTVRT